MAPPTPITGSPMKAAMRSGPMSSTVRSSSSIRTSVAFGPMARSCGIERWTNPGGRGSNPSRSGSIPVAVDFQEVVGAPLVISGIAQADCAIHSPNEHLVVDNYHRGIEAVIRFICGLAGDL